LDYAASTPLDDAVVEAMLTAMRGSGANLSSTHAQGREVLAKVEQARQELGDLLGVPKETAAEELFFVSGTTEANNIVIKGVMLSEWAQRSGRCHIITSAIEHPSVANVVNYMEAQHKCQVTRVGVDKTGRINVEDVAAAVIPGRTALITIMHANNEVGKLQPIKEVCALDAVRQNGVLVHTDAAQTVGKVPMAGLCATGASVDFLSVASHKFYGPQGVGGLYIRRGTPRLYPLLHGGGQESGMRPGNSNVVSIVGFGAACRMAREHLDERIAHMRTVRDNLQSRLEQHFTSSSSSSNNNSILVHGHPIHRLPNMCSWLCREACAASPRRAGSKSLCLGGRCLPKVLRWQFCCQSFCDSLRHGCRQLLCSRHDSLFCRTRHFCRHH
jgi:cysteine desulfurase